MSDVTRGDVLKAEFEKWLVEKKTFTQSSVAKSIGRLQNLSSNKNSISVFEIDKLDSLKRLQKSIIKTIYFKQFPANDRISCIIAFKLYIEFLSQLDVVLMAEGKIQADYHELESGFSSQKFEYADSSKVFNRNSPITVVLHDQQYQLLIEALRHDNIVTLGQLADINVVSYINSKNLYSWKERLIVWKGLRVSLDPYRSTFKALMQIPDEDASDVDERISAVIDYNLQKMDISTERLSVIAEKSSIADISTQVVVDIARFIKKCGLFGCSSGDIQRYSQLKNRTIVNLLAENNNIVEICKGKYIHRDCIVDLEEAADTIKSILLAQFEQFMGYSSARLLYDTVRIDLSMFLNDNDFDNIDTIYHLAKHLFSKESYGGETYVFYGNTHIWRQEPDYPKSVKGLLIHNARMAQSTIGLEECETFLRKLGFSAGNTKQQMQITLEPTFLQYDVDKYLLGETLCINEQWTDSLTKSLVELFEDIGFVISRDIRNEWYQALPSLPFGLPWTRLLLQEILAYYPTIGYRTISALAGQTTDTIHAAIVPKESSICTFSDFVSALFLHEKMSWQRLAAEELRLLLRQRGVLAGNELYCNMSKALDDYRFAWDNENKTVLINVGC